MYAHRTELFYPHSSQEMRAVADVGVTELDHDRVLADAFVRQTILDASPMPKLLRGVHRAPSHERCIRI